MPNRQWLPGFLIASLAAICAAPTHAAEKPIKAFILAGQSNMVGWGDSTELPDELRKGNERVLMFEGGKWQPLRPSMVRLGGQRFQMTCRTLFPRRWTVGILRLSGY